MASFSGTFGADTLMGGVGNDILDSGAGDDTLAGGDGGDTLLAGAGNDILDGGTGADSMDGGTGNDFFRVDNSGDVVVDSGGGIDTVESSASITLGLGIEVLTLTGTGNVSGVGNTSSNTITGTSGANYLSGASGNDTLIAYAGNDILDGGTGIDRMDGGTGDDLYRVDTVGDVLIEAFGAGNDTVESSVSVTLASNIEVLKFTTTANVGGTGNDLANTIIGNEAINNFSGMSGNDTLIGAGGNDYLTGGLGNDSIDGGSGTADVAVFTGARAGYSIAVAGDGTVTVTDINGADGNEGVDVLRGTETLRFSDGSQTSANFAPNAAADKSFALLEDAAATSLGIAAPTDADADQLTIRVTAVPQGGLGTVRLADIDGGGVVVLGQILTSAQLTRLVFTPNANAAGTGTFAYRVTDPSLAADTQTVTFTVAPVADAPTLTLADSTGVVNGAIALHITAVLTDGSETLSLAVSGLPVGARLSDGVHTFTAAAGNVDVDITGWTLSDLSLTPPAGSDIDFTFEVTATSTDSGAQASASGSVNVTVNTVGGNTLMLSSLNGTNGFRLDGSGLCAFSGMSVASAGDVNGDGFDDLLVGAPWAYSSTSMTGESYLVFGKAGGWTSGVSAPSLNGTNGFAIGGAAAYDAAGWSVASAGDVNGDGLDDFVIGAPAAANYSGASYLIFGKAGGWAPDFSVSTLNGVNGFRLSAGAVADQLGWSVASAGDINGDGFDDLIVGAPSADFGGAAYVVFGKGAGWAANLNITSLNGSNGFRLTGPGSADYAAASVASAGDVNGDGYDDMIVGVDGADLNGGTSGAAYVVFGKAGGWAASTSLGNMNGSNGFRLEGVAAGDQAGHCVASAGDINGDGYGDLIIGAPYADSGGLSSGASYVVFGKAGGWAASLDLADLNGGNGFRIVGAEAGDWSGRSVASAGDINGDGYDDLIIGAGRADSGGMSSGTAYVVFGHAGGWAASLDLGTVDGSQGFRLIGAGAGDGAGLAVASAGDINGDGFDDMLVGSPYAGADDQSGSTYVLFGRAFNYAVTHLGTSSDDVLDGTTAEERFVGGLGDDTMYGGGGADAFQGGGGNDTFVLGAGLQREADGGSGSDTVSLGAAQAMFDFRAIDNGRFIDVEKLDFAGGQANTVTMSTLDMLNMVGAGKELTIDGDTNDSFTLIGNWTLVGVVDGHFEYALDQQSTGPAGHPTVWVDTDLVFTLLH